MRVALLSYRSKPHCGGQGIYIRHLSRELVALGHTVEVFSGQPYPELDPGVALTKLPRACCVADACEHALGILAALALLRGESLWRSGRHGSPDRARRLWGPCQLTELAPAAFRSPRSACPAIGMGFATQ